MSKMAAVCNVLIVIQNHLILFVICRHIRVVVVVVVVVEINIIKVALSHCCCKTTVQC